MSAISSNPPQAEVLSLTIPYKNIPQWLRDRKKLHKDWGKRLISLNIKLDLILKELENEQKYPQIREYILKNKDCDYIYYIYI